MKDIYPRGRPAELKAEWMALNEEQREAFTTGSQPVPDRFAFMANKTRTERGLPSFPFQWYRDWPNQWPQVLPDLADWPED